MATDTLGHTHARFYVASIPESKEHTSFHYSSKYDKYLSSMVMPKCSKCHKANLGMIGRESLYRLYFYPQQKINIPFFTLMLQPSTWNYSSSNLRNIDDFTTQKRYEYTTFSASSTNTKYVTPFITILLLLKSTKLFVLQHYFTSKAKPKFSLDIQNFLHLHVPHYHIYTSLH